MRARAKEHDILYKTIPFMRKGNSMSKKGNVNHTLDKLLLTMETLLGPQGCPWDKVQTHQSLVPCLIEESYEVIDTIDRKHTEDFKEELGDLFLQILFHAHLAEKDNLFCLDEIFSSLNHKLIRRHPHVFSKDSKSEVNNASEALKQWHELKEQELNHSGHLLDQIKVIFPALKYAHKLQSKAATVGFDWASLEDVMIKVEEELEELKETLPSENKSRTEEEIGDLLFSVVNLARHLHIDAENALRLSSQKFKKRFNQMENEMNFDKTEMKKLGLDQWDKLWDEAKNSLRPNSP